MENACYHSVKNLLSTCLLSTNNNIKTYRTTICLLFYKDMTPASLTLRKENRLRVLRRVLREDIWGKRKKKQEAGENCTVFMIGTAHGGQDRWHYERQDRCVQGLVRKLVGKGRPRCWLEDIKMDLKEMGWGKAWIGLIWLRTVTSSRMLWTWQWKSRFHATQGISHLAEELLASHEQLCSMESVSQLVSQTGQFSWYNNNHSKFLGIPFMSPTNWFSDSNFMHCY